MLRVHAGSGAPILVRVVVLGVDIGESRLNRLEFVASDPAVEDFNTTGRGVEFPARLRLEKRDREGKIVLAQHQDRPLAGLHADGMLGLIGIHESLSRVCILHAVPGIDDLRGFRTEHLEDVFRGAGFRRGGQSGRGVVGRLEGLLGRCSRGYQDQRSGCDQARGPAPITPCREKPFHDHILDRVGICAPPASQS